MFQKINKSFYYNIEFNYGRFNEFYLMSLFFNLQVRSHMASLGIRKFQDLIGRTDLLQVRKDITIEKAKTLNLSNVLRCALDLRPGVNIKGGTVKQDFQLENRLDNKLILMSEPILKSELETLSTSTKLRQRLDINMNINNECRAFGSTLSYHVAK